MLLPVLPLLLVDHQSRSPQLPYGQSEKIPAQATSLDSLATTDPLDSLWAAVEKGDQSSLTDLIQRGAITVNILKTTRGAPPATILHAATKHPNLIPILVKAGADLRENLADPSNTPLSHYAKTNSFEAMTSALQQLGIILKGQELENLITASGSEMQDHIQAEVQKIGARLYEELEPDQYDKLVQLLTEYRFSPNCYLSNGETPLGKALWNYYSAKWIQTLLDNGADREFRDLHNQTPLQIAKTNGGLEDARKAVLGVDTATQKIRVYYTETPTARP